MHIAKLVVVGVGLIGGSCALALRHAGVVGQIVGVGRTQANLDDALRLGVIDRARLLEDDWTAELHDADIVLVAAPVAQYADLFALIAPAIGIATIVTDAGSTKQDVIATACAAFGPRMATFVPAHPIAGTAHSGAAAALPGLYDGHIVIVTPLPETDAVALARVTALWQACGARVATLDAARHDRIYAAVSHLPHLLAFAYVAELAARPDAAQLLAHGGGGFRDFTRIAGGSPEMWRDIALANRGALQAELRAYRAALDELAGALDARDGAALERMFARSRTARQAWETAADRRRDGGEE
ncbi:MAG TPA: prephenate dehydrogenase/arogenate dehydrogenase family protein [Casimicrobiaceae bacterium]